MSRKVKSHAVNTRDVIVPENGQESGGVRKVFTQTVCCNTITDGKSVMDVTPSGKIQVKKITGIGQTIGMFVPIFLPEPDTLISTLFDDYVMGSLTVYFFELYYNDGKTVADMYGYKINDPEYLEFKSREGCGYCFYVANQYAYVDHMCKFRIHYEDETYVDFKTFTNIPVSNADKICQFIFNDGSVFDDNYKENTPFKENPIISLRRHIISLRNFDDRDFSIVKGVDNVLLKDLYESYSPSSQFVTYCDLHPVDDKVEIEICGLTNLPDGFPSLYSEVGHYYCFVDFIQDHTAEIFHPMVTFTIHYSDGSSIGIDFSSQNDYSDVEFGDQAIKLGKIFLHNVNVI